MHALVRTSQSHPLQIALLSSPRMRGRIGISFCPGKIQPDGASGAWQRDLGTDLDAIAGAGFACVVSLIEHHEMERLGVGALGDEVARRHIDWLWLPIRDVSVPDADFERAWGEVGEGLRARLRDGFDILVHCKGGLGRAGTIAARLLVELGTAPDEAIARVRAIRPGAIETRAQEAHVRSIRPIPPAQPARDSAAVRDRALGAMLGLAIGDAVGTTLEFTPRDTKALLTDMVGGGPFRLTAGQWTDDTAMALALADSLVAHPLLDPGDLMDRFVDWHRDGLYSCTGRCFDIGVTTRDALARYRRTGDPYAGSTDPMAAGNGSLMRLAPVAIRYWDDAETRADGAARQSRTTHAAPEAVDACVGYADRIADAIAGVPRTEVLRDRVWPRSNAVAAIEAGRWRGKHRGEIRSSGYVAHSLEAALWAVGRTGDFRSAVLTAANLGDDADTIAAIAGQLAGALYGVSGIPAEWVERVAWKEQISEAATTLIMRRDI